MASYNRNAAYDSSRYVSPAGTPMPGGQGRQKEESKSPTLVPAPKLSPQELRKKKMMRITMLGKAVVIFLVLLSLAVVKLNGKVKIDRAQNQLFQEIQLLNETQREHERLSAQIGIMYSTDRIKSFAEANGMRPMERNQTFYLDCKTGDKVVNYLGNPVAD
ncbi:MAG: hypothetical protein ACOYJX_00880 [Acutalibacteraceae bacterium]|jgi:cell division protein FtsL